MDGRSEPPEGTDLPAQRPWTSGPRSEEEKCLSPWAAWFVAVSQGSGRTRMQWRPERRGCQFLGL